MDRKVLNCWKFMDCGREPGGRNVEAHGLCPAAIAEEFDRTNKGTNGGRICWSVAGTFCQEEEQGTFAKGSKVCGQCLQCPFFLKVQEKEGRHLVMIVRERE